MTNTACSEIMSCTDVVKLLRIQRHDFLNHLQVIHAMIQLGRDEKALQYIEKLAHDPEMISNVLTTYKNEHI
ncbi:Spo0B domain-containing protein [Sporomusa sp.]|uniref:Spo0B domain-containing protein n=1 Tax=Sporomusa sp. TaxID=2078658 RepID=UPI002BBD1324|nr:Spo0B domain-containing protein [Sporomusa sp.]HWR41570.1 Spo0B domain-containing protein [Sporomusa sp.]